MDKYHLSATIWNKAPASVRGNTNRDLATTHKNATRGQKQSRPKFPNFSDPHFSSNNSNTQHPTQAIDINRPSSDTLLPQPEDSTPLPDNQSAIGITDDGDRSNASTPLTRGSSITATQAKFRDIDAMIKRQQKMIDHHAKQAADRLSSIEQHFKRFDDLNRKIDQVGDQVLQASKENQDMVKTMCDEFDKQNQKMQANNLVYQDHCDTQIEKLGTDLLASLEDNSLLRQEFAKLSHYMMRDLTSRPSPVAEPKRRKQRTKRDHFEDLMAGVSIPDDDSPGDTSMIEETEDETEFYSKSSHHSVTRRLDTAFQELSRPPHEAVDIPLPPSPTQASLPTSPISTQVISSPSTQFASLDPRNTNKTGLAEADDK